MLNLLIMAVSGFLVPECDSSAIAKAIDYILSNPDKWSSLQLAAVNKVRQEFDKEKENDKLEAIFYTLLEQ